MRQRNKPFRYTVKIYGEGLTEWVYFDSLRTSSRFRFSLEPEIPDLNRLAKAIGFGVLSCKRDRAGSANYTEVFRVVRFCRLLSKYTELKSLLEGRLRREVEFIPKYTEDGATLQILHEGMECCKLTYEGNRLRGSGGDGKVYEVGDALPLSLQTPFLEDLVAWFSDRD